ncbi:MAG: HEAT repeat domain-containing protein [Candidatus Promineifilaceae bacterium]
MNQSIAPNHSLEDLKTRFYSTDQDTSGLALADLIDRGKEALPILVEALTHTNARTRRLAAEGLSEIADPASADALFAATHDTNDEVRARAATALYRMGDKRALAVLVAGLNDYPDELHNPYTATMYPLMRGGKEVLPLVVPLLQAPAALTRERAFLVVKAVASRVVQGQSWEQLWQSLGRYDPADSPAEQNKAAQQWQEWLAQD